MIKHIPFHLLLIIIITTIHPTFSLTTDGILLLSFKYSVLSDPSNILSTWNYSDDTPCSWNGVVCTDTRVTGISLPNSKLIVSIPANLGLIEHLQQINLSNNSVNGSIPLSLYTAPELQVFDLSNNLISGEVIEHAGGWNSLRSLNLSGNLLTGTIPKTLGTLQNLTVALLNDNYFSGEISGGFDYIKVLDLSSNFINGTLPENFTGGGIEYFNVSHNNISGEIPASFAKNIPANARIDLSYNNLTGAIPESRVLFNQSESSFAGNRGLCGKPLKELCVIPSTASTYPPAIAGFPETTPSSHSNNNYSNDTSGGKSKNRFKTSTIVGIVVGDVAVVAILVFIFIYILKRHQRCSPADKDKCNDRGVNNQDNEWEASSDEDERKTLRSWGCIIKRRSVEGEELSEMSSSDCSDTKRVESENNNSNSNNNNNKTEDLTNGLVTVDGGGKGLELETLLKASAYILGTSGSSIIYKAVLEDGTALAVRRIGENGLERFKDFENQVRVIARLVHPNLVRVRGFYWGAEEKLVIYDYVPYGNLANARYRKVGSSPCPLPWGVRLTIAIGTARGLLYIHDKKQVHGNLKPSNILLGSDMEPKIGDFGLERLLAVDQSCKVGGSTRTFGSKRSNTSRDSFTDMVVGPKLSPSPSSMGCISPYYAPESLRNLKPSPKWDVYSYGVILLELLTGKVFVSDEFGPASMTWNSTLTIEEKKKVLRMVDVAIRADMEGKEEALLALLRVAYSCISPVPQKRPHMKEVLHALEKFPFGEMCYL
ncbi:putative LRR receptor-like serine/threonine-protein kinase At4g37250 [Bidens hawaiensis]|uniref:putative LRR receptor-like serine/threonine-protein kinase At4g37250 n=1 Tax=Bidens hawaiensis TaxID=980011 RepID=UPI0040494330